MEHKLIAELGAVRRRRGVTYYHQVYTLLQMALADGTIAAGTALPSESELMARFQVSRNTVRRALGQLEAEKRIVRRRGSGSYARSMPPPSVTAEAVAEIIEDAESARSHTSSRLLRIQNGPTPEYVRRRDPQFGDVSMMVQRCRSYQDSPFLLTTSFVPGPLAARLTRRQLAGQTVLVALEGIGAAPANAEQTITVLCADSVSARYLGVEPAAALLCVQRLIRDREGRSIEHQSHLCRPDRFQIQSRLTIDRSGGSLAWLEGGAAQVPAWL
jgi:GntR family transcriptional regulator